MAEDWFREQLEGLQKWLIPKAEWTLVMLGMIGVGLLGIWAYLQFTAPRSSSSSGYRRKVIALSRDKVTVSPVFARCWYFKVVEDTRTVKIVENPYREAVPAGPPAAEFVKSLGAQQVVAGSFGAIAERRLRELGVEPVVMHACKCPDCGEEFELHKLRPSR